MENDDDLSDAFIQLLSQQNDIWNLENGYNDKFTGSEYPLRSIDSGRGTALIASLQLYERYIENICRETIGFKVFLNTPGEELKVSQHFHVASPDDDLFIMIKPKIITSSSELDHYNPSHRQCFFSYEHQLRFFRNYTQSNCEMECLANFTATECGCVKFSMPSTFLIDFSFPFPFLLLNFLKKCLSNSTNCFRKYSLL